MYIYNEYVQSYLGQGANGSHVTGKRWTGSCWRLVARSETKYLEPTRPGGNAQKQIHFETITHHLPTHITCGQLDTRRWRPTGHRQTPALTNWLAD